MIVNTKSGTRSKYRAVKTEIDGIKFASKKEARRYQELKLLEKAGEIKDLRCQYPITLIDKSKYGREIKYYADFVYIENDELILEDTKGYRTDVYKLKKRLVAERYGMVIRET